MKILVLASDNPSPPITGSRIRNYHLWPIIRDMGHDVRILCLTRDPEDLAKSNPECEFFMFSKKNIFIRIWMRLFHSYHEWPFSDELKSKVQELTQEWQPDIIHGEELRMGLYLPDKKSIPKNSIISICVHNVESELIKKTLPAPFRFGVRVFNRIYQYTLKRAELKIFTNSDVRYSYSEHDKKVYESIYPQFKWESSSNGVPLLDLPPQDLSVPIQNKILFLGSLNYSPNVQGLFWFLDNIYPQVKNDCELIVAGSRPIDEIKTRLKQENIQLFDTPLDLKPIYLQSSLLLVPLLSGSGTRGKILESLMFSRPVLTTSIGVEGLHLKPEEGILLADGQSEYLNKLKWWLNSSSQTRDKIASQGRKAVMDRYTWNHVAKSMIESWDKKRKLTQG